MHERHLNPFKVLDDRARLLPHDPRCSWMLLLHLAIATGFPQCDHPEPSGGKHCFVTDRGKHHPHMSQENYRDACLQVLHEKGYSSSTYYDGPYDEPEVSPFRLSHRIWEGSHSRDIWSASWADPIRSDAEHTYALIRLTIRGLAEIESGIQSS